LFVHLVIMAASEHGLYVLPAAVGGAWAFCTVALPLRVATAFNWSMRAKGNSVTTELYGALRRFGSG